MKRARNKKNKELNKENMPSIDIEENVSEEEIVSDAKDDADEEAISEAQEVTDSAEETQDAPEAEKSEEPSRKKKGSKALKTVIITLCSILVLTAGAAAYVYPWNNVARGVSVEGTSIGGKSQEEAKEILNKNSLEETQAIRIKDASGAETEFTAGDVALQYDVDRTVEKAMEIGRGQDIWENVKTLAMHIASPEDLDYEFSYDEEKLQSLLYDFGVSVLGEQNDFSLTYNGDTVTVGMGTPGQDRDVSGLISEILKNVSDGKADISVVLEKTDPKEPTAQNIYDAIHQDPKDAEYKLENNKIIITPEVIGRDADMAEIEEKVSELAGGNEITLKLTMTKPQVTEESINSQLFGYVLSEYTTDYSTSSKNRVCNVELAASKVNGKILMPGDEFSYNNIVGKRTAENGFMMAHVFENGETVEGMGGGVCQVSSTIYSAVLYAGLQVTERQNHSMTVGYVPKGQDATVSYGSIDFKFKNDTNSPIRITAVTAGKKLTVRIYGAKPANNRKIEVVNSITKTTAPTVSEKQNPSLAAGVRKTVSSGKTGYTVSTTRKIYENGELVKTETMPRSVYKMIPTTVEVGTGQAAPAANTNVTPSTPNTEKPKEQKPQETKPQETAPQETPHQEATPEGNKGAESDSQGAQRPEVTE